MLDNAFEELKKLDWGTDLAKLSPIEDAIVAGHGKPETLADLEKRFVVILGGDLSLAAKEYVCRKLAVIGTAASVPTLASLLPNKEISHMSRFALERIAGPQSAQALKDALSKVGGDLKIGVIGSLGSRRDSDAVPALGQLLKDADKSIARSAAMALGTIGTNESVTVLQSALNSSPSNPAALIDALLECAETLLAAGKRDAANAIYKTFADENQNRLVRLAATRGLLACASKQA